MRSFTSLASLKGRVALVTGGAGYIGRAIAETYAELGAAVAILDRPGSGAEDVARHLTETYGVLTTVLAVDLADEAAVRKVPQRVVDTCGRLDILVNNAAFVGTDGLEGWTTPVEEQSIDTWRRALEINLTAPFLLVQQAIPALKASGRGAVINIGSIYGVVGPDWRIYEEVDFGTPAAYGASKGGLLQMTRWLATTLAPDIRVNAIVPGGVERNTPNAFRKRYMSRTPLARMATEEDFIGAAAYLASDLSAYVTGECIMVDGGWTAW
ncbi:MAG: SDR family oxidoreductase [Rhodospirillaceae bacterium]|nr:MAG: SDR family oxidoreductase [Rhodospirillaceae bacterium]